MIGYMNGLALTILVGQLPKLFGFSVDGDGLIGEFVGFVQGLAHGDVVPAAAAVGLGGIVVILVLQRWWAKVPAVLVMVVLAIVVSTVFRLGEHGVSLIGVLPKGFPPLTIPSVGWSDVGPLAAGALAIALVSLADTISTASSFAGRTGQEVHGNQEMIGIGAANLAAGLFQGFPVSTSASRTAVAERAGAKSQLTGVIGAALIIVMIVFLPGLFRDLPQAALAAVVITAALSLADLPATARLWHQRKVEFSLSIVAFLGVALLGVLPGIGDRGRPVDPQRLPPGVAAVPDDARAGRRACRATTTSTPTRTPSCCRGWCSTASTRRCSSPTPRRSATRSRRSRAAIRRPQWIVVAAEPITDVDTTAADVLFDLDRLLDERGQTLVFAELKDPVRRKIDRYGLTRAIEPRHFFPTVEAAVDAWRAKTGARWAAPAADAPRGGGRVPQPRPS